MKKNKNDNPTVKKLQDIEKEIAETAALRDELKAHWLLEKDLISEIRNLKGELETLKTEADNLERKGELGKVAEIRYGKMIEMEKQIDAKSEKLNELQKNKKMLRILIDKKRWEIFKREITAPKGTDIKRLTFRELRRTTCFTFTWLLTFNNT